MQKLKPPELENYRPVRFYIPKENYEQENGENSGFRACRTYGAQRHSNCDSGSFLGSYPLKSLNLPHYCKIFKEN